MANDQHNEFYQSLDGELTPEQVAQLLELGDEGDTAGKKPADTDAAPDASTGKEGQAAAGDADTNGNEQEQDGGNDGQQAAGQADGANTAGATSEPDPANTVILAKDGKHTISYDKLVEARNGEKTWKAAAEAAQAQLADLQAQAQARADAGQAPTKVDNQAAIAQAAIDQGVDEGLFGDFSEEALAKGIAALVKQQVAASVAPLEQKLAPIQQKQATDANTSHYNAIYEAHPDADSIVESKELADWIASQPSFVRDGFNGVLTKGTTTQVIELFDTFKKATGTAQQPASDAAKVAAAAKAAVAKAPTEPPASLTDFPGGRAGATSRTDAMADMDAVQLLGEMDSMTPEQLERYLNSL